MSRKATELCMFFCLILVITCNIPAAAAEKVKTSYGVWGDNEQVQRFRELANLFNSKHPDMEVEIVHIAAGSGDYVTKLLTLMVSGTAPDTFHMGVPQLVQFARNGMIENLLSYLNRDRQLKLESFYPPVLELGKYQGGQYGLPPDANPVVLFFNADMFANSGVTSPIMQDRNGRWNWSTLRETAKKLTRNTGDATKDAYGFHVRNYWGLTHPFIWAGGGDLWGADAKSVRLTESASLQGLEFLASMIHEDRSAISTLPGSVPALFNSQRLGMTPNNRSVLPQYKTSITVNWDYAPMPTGPAGRSAVILTAFSAMNKNTPNKDAAWEWLRFFVGPEGQRFRLGDNGNAVPTVRGLEDTVMGPGSIPANSRVLLDTFAYGRTNHIAEALYPDLSTLAMNAFAEIWKGTKSARMIAEEMKPKAEAIMAQGTAR